MATIRDLSNYTGFSVTTISRVLNHDPTLSVTDATRSTILEAADTLNYATSRLRGSAKNRPLHIAIAQMMSKKEQLWDPYYLYLKNYVVRSCMERGNNVSYLAEQAGGYQILEKVALDGILAIGIFSEKQIAQMTEISPSIVFVDSSPDEQRFDSVVLNFRLGIEQALDYLMARGHKRIGFLGPAYKFDQKKRPALEVRWQYFEEYMKRVGRYDESFMVDTKTTVEGTRACIEEWLKAAKELPTALVTYNEGTAITAVGVFREAGLRIPEDISIISFNDTPLSVLVDPPLTSINAHLSDMGEMAVKLLTERKEASKHLPYKVVLPLTLTERGSVMDCKE